MRTILITGANGFIGKNLQLHLAERSHQVPVHIFRLVWCLSHLMPKRPQEITPFLKRWPRFVLQFMRGNQILSHCPGRIEPAG